MRDSLRNNGKKTINDHVKAPLYMHFNVTDKLMGVKKLFHSSYRRRCVIIDVIPFVFESIFLKITAVLVGISMDNATHGEKEMSQLFRAEIRNYHNSKSKFTQNFVR